MASRTASLLAGAALAALAAPALAASAADPPGGRALGLGIVRLADADGSGTVESWEWNAFLVRLDPDGDGVVPVSRLARAVGRDGTAPESTPAGEARRAFFLRVFDRDGSGAIETSDLDDIFFTLDRDRSGDLSAAEVPSLPRPRRAKLLPRP